MPLLTLVSYSVAPPLMLNVFLKPASLPMN
jgi:hypothetical protein